MPAAPDTCTTQHLSPISDLQIPGGVPEAQAPEVSQGLAFDPNLNPGCDGKYIIFADMWGLKAL